MEDTLSNILIVDDQACFRELLSDELTRDGYRVASVDGGERAKAYFKSSPVDLVILDLHPEEPGGFGLLEHIKRQHPRVPVIIVTAHHSCGVDHRLRHADGHVIKRVRFWDELKEKMAHVLTGRNVTVGTSMV